MKRWFSAMLAVLMLVSVTACGDTQDNKKTDDGPVSMDPADYVPLEPLVYTELPTNLKAEKVGSVSNEVTAANGGLYYKEDDNYGIMTLDGKVDTGAIYALCQPRGKYFIVAKTTGDVSKNITSANVVGLVDGLGREIIPLEYASVELMGERFARVAKLTGRTENAEEKLTQFTDGEKTVLCTGNWYIYDLKTGQLVPGATGTKPYISFDCGGYVKYVLDNKEVKITTADGTAIPEDILHLNNGYYVVEADYTVYNSDAQEQFTYDPKEYVPVDSKGIEGYILATKKVGGKDAYVLLDTTGKVVSAVFDHKPSQYGSLFLVGDSLVNLDGSAVVQSGCKKVYWEPIYGQSWAVDNGKTIQVIDRLGKVLFENKATDSSVDTTLMMAYKKSGDKRYYYSSKDKGFTVGGVGLAPFLVKKANGETYYDVVNVLNGEAILTGYVDYLVSDAEDTMVYVYALKSDDTIDVYVIR